MLLSPQRRQSEDVAGHGRRYHHEEDPNRKSSEEEVDRYPDGHPQEDDGRHLHLQRYPPPVLLVVPDLLAEDPVGQEPAVKAFRAPVVAVCREEEERRGRQKGQNDTDDAESEGDCACDDPERSDSSTPGLQLPCGPGDLRHRTRTETGFLGYIC